MNLSASDIALLFKDLSVTSLIPPKPILNNISGFVKKGGITAVLGSSASGKSLLLKSLSGRLNNLSIIGEAFINGIPIDPKSLDNPVAYVSQHEMLIGDMTAKEMLTTMGTLKINQSKTVIESKVSQVLSDFDISHVADTYIGTIFRAGLSGGQKRRVDIGLELIAPPSILLLDEPTSGLDSHIAYEVLSKIKQRCQENSDLSVILTIHQPNSKILELFDHILLLGSGSMLFFGTLQEAVDHFTNLGAIPPPHVVPTDYFLQVTDSKFTDEKIFDFEGAFSTSKIYFDLVDILEQVCRKGEAQILSNDYDIDDVDKLSPHTSSIAIQPVSTVQTLENELDMDSDSGNLKKPSFLTQYLALLKRELLVASRDPTLYYLQFVLAVMYGVMIGAVFYQLDYKIDASMYFIPGGILWICLVTIYAHIFKVYHIVKSYERFLHERANHACSTLAYWLVELTMSALSYVVYIPGVVMAYFMEGFPGHAFPYLILLFWVSTVAAESMIYLVAKFFKDATPALVACQLVLVILTAFGGGVFIPWYQVPGYWNWLQALSIFMHSSRSAIIEITRELTFQCTLSGGQCVGVSGQIFECASYSTDGLHCSVDGNNVLKVTQSIDDGESHWNSFGWLCLCLVCYRLAGLLLMYFPYERIVYDLYSWYQSPEVINAIVESKLKIRQLQGQVYHLLSFHVLGGHNYESMEQRTLPEIPAITPKLGASYSQSMKNFKVSDSAIGEKRVLKPSLIWKNVSLRLKKGDQRTLLDDLSGFVESGRVLALMGPSGAGKTTLLNALSNRAPYGNLTGSVTFGGEPLQPKDLMYVPQFDALKDYYTVKDQILFIGLMKCKNVKEVKSRLLKVLQILGLMDKANVLCKDLTGGELKRVSIGMGMIAHPRVLFLDEPTTGLDSTASFYLVKYLVSLAQSVDIPIIMTIHQPATIVFEMLQDLYLLSSGKLAYFGQITSAEQYFARLGFECSPGDNPADFYLDVVYETKSDWKKTYIESDIGQIMTKSLNRALAAKAPAKASDDEPSVWSKIQTVFIFYFRYYYTDAGYYMYRVVYLFLAAVFVGTLFKHLTPNTNNMTKYSGAIFFNIWTTLFACVGSTALVASDRRQVGEQIKNGVIQPYQYCIGQFVATIPYNIVCSIIFQCTFHWISHINPDEEAFFYAIVITAVNITLMESIMITVVEVVKNAMLSVTSALIVLGTLFLFSGFFIQVNEMPIWIRWMGYAVPTKYSFDGYVRQMFHNQEFTVGSTGFKISGEYVLENFYDNQDVDSWGMVGAVIAYVFLFRLTHYGLMVMQNWTYLVRDRKIGEIVDTREAIQEKAYEMVPQADKADAEIV